MSAKKPKADASAIEEPDWKRVERLEAEQQAAMDAEAEMAPKAPKAPKGEWNRVAQMEAEQQAAMDAEAAKANKKGANKTPSKVFGPEKTDHATTRGIPKEATRSVPVSFFESFLGGGSKKEQKHASSQSRSRESSVSYQSNDEERDIGHGRPRGQSKLDPDAREEILFDPEEEAEKRQKRRERRVSRQQGRSERLSVHDLPKEHRRTRSPSIRLFRVDDDDEDDEQQQQQQQHRKHKTRPRSTSNKAFVVDPALASPPKTPRRSSHTLWPSFSTSQRRSAGDILDNQARRTSHARTHSDDHHPRPNSRSEVSIRKLEFAEYLAGKKLDHIPLSPPKTPERPIGYVRSRSHTGEYFEGYTRNATLLRTPSQEEVVDFADHHHHDEMKHHRKTRLKSTDHHKEKPWQVKLMQEIARR